MMICNSEQHDGKTCDVCGLDHTDGQTFQLRAAALARGATGRVCEVMWFCDDCANKSTLGEFTDVNVAREFHGPDADY